ncbi:MAG: hypothetical protein ACREHE_05230 [Rhizomicrobium sp.]
MAESTCDNDSDDASAHKSYLAERATLVNALEDQTKFIDQITIALAGGSLGLSLTFLHDLSQPAILLWCLCIGSGCLVGSIVCVLVSLHTSQASLNRQTRALDNAMAQHRFSSTVVEMQGQNYVNAMARFTAKLNIAAPILLIAGMALLLLFSYINESSDITRRVMANGIGTGKVTSVPAPSTGVQRGIVPMKPAVQPPQQSQPQPTSPKAK